MGLFRSMRIEGSKVCSKILPTDKPFLFHHFFLDLCAVGFVPVAEIVNGRLAMFFLVTGLLTEYWTGVSLPGQVEEMLRISGVIGFG